MVIVEHDDVDAPLRPPLVGADVRCGRRRHGRSGRPHERQEDLREGADRLRLALLEDLEVVGRQARDDAAVLVGHDDVDDDLID